MYFLSFELAFDHVCFFTQTPLLAFDVACFSNKHQCFLLLQVLNFSSPVIVGPQQTVMPLLLLFHPNATQLTFTTTLTLHTNASTFLIPLIVYNGLLKVTHQQGSWVWRIRTQ